MSFLRIVYVLSMLLGALNAAALVNYESGSLEVNGVLLLADSANPDRYYYLPPTPRIAQRKDGGYELSLVKFVDPAGATSGGLLHLLTTLTLPTAELNELKKAVKEINSRAEIAGPVPLLQKEEGSFSVVSASLSDNKLTSSLITSGKAPVTPGARSAVAASLSPQGATLLWESLSKPTSDVSISVSAYYEVALPSFNAKINADVSTVYEHFSKLKNRQGGYDRKQIRDITDELTRTGVIKIDVMDRLPEATANKAMQSLVDMISQKLTDTIFDQKTGFTAIPEKETAVEKGQIKDRKKRGWLAKVFKGSGNQKYVSDNQFVLKKRSDINRANFSINLNRRAVVKIPLHISGNISGLYQEYKDNPAMFRVVNLADPAFQKRELFFRIDGDFSDLFEQDMNFAAVSIRKKYKDHDTATGELIFTREDLRDGLFSKNWTYARLGEKGSDWLDYEYRISWSLKGGSTVTKQSRDENWIAVSTPIVTIAPPLQKTTLEVDADRFLFEDANIASGMLEVRYKVLGKQKKKRVAVMRPSDAESLLSATLFHDKGSTIEYKVNWYKRGGGSEKGEWQPLEESYLVLVPPGL
ncbi:MAG: hypothetical protein D6B27_08240 [Gammaproteobacteria bacterium]|nr:MAG: hypothetical protein D6B27_08240 [Gammaproteobacteria bacterium]